MCPRAHAHATTLAACAREAVRAAVWSADVSVCKPLSKQKHLSDKQIRIYSTHFSELFASACAVVAAAAVLSKQNNKQA